MADFHDVEKAAQAPGTSETTTDGKSSESGGESPTLQPLKTRASSRHSRHSRHSQVEHPDPYDSDPYEALETALSAPGVETEAERVISRARTGTSIASNASRHPDFEVTFDEDDPLNPKNWSLWYRGWVIFSVSISTWAVVLYSTSYTASMPGLMEEFNVSDPTVITLGVTTYLVGLALGSLVVAPMSELYGRRPVYIICLVIYTLLVIPSCLATSLAEILVVRFFG